jgi:hypothetical protein
MAKAPYFNHAKNFPTLRNTKELRTIHDVARLMNAEQKERMPLLSIGKEVKIHRPDPNGPLKWKRKRNEETNEWEWVPA